MFDQMYKYAGPLGTDGWDEREEFGVKIKSGMTENVESKLMVFVDTSGYDKDGPVEQHSDCDYHAVGRHQSYWVLLTDQSTIPSNSDGMNWKHLLDHQGWVQQGPKTKITEIVIFQLTNTCSLQIILDTIYYMTYSVTKFCSFPSFEAPNLGLKDTLLVHATRIIVTVGGSHRSTANIQLVCIMMILGVFLKMSCAKENPLLVLNI